DAVDARGRAAMRRRSELEGVDHAREVRIDFFPAVTRDLERLVHDVGTMVPDRPRAQLNTVANEVILPGEDVERILRLERFHFALRHRERIVREVDLLLLV